MARTLQGAVESGRGGAVATIKRPWWSRFSAGHAFIAVIGVLAFLLNLMVLRGVSDTELFAVANTDILAGSVLTPDLVRFLEVAGSPDLISRLLSEDAVALRTGDVVTRPIAAGDPVTVAALVSAAGFDGRRAMSLPVEMEHAAGGRLITGDRVDVVAVTDGVARFVATDLEVVGTPEPTRAGLGTSGGYYVVVAVDARIALGLAEAMATARIEVIHSTGADAIGPGG